MPDRIISAKNLGKKYLISHQQTRRFHYVTLRDIITDAVRSLGKRIVLRNKDINPRSVVEEFWAIRDVSFEVKQGEVFGIIGRNGAGKSTLLKILSRVTQPNTGRVTIKGRVASLLEVGTGFHPELTGRENIFLNGAILGMRKTEIKKNFDRIVAFAEIERFLDTPLKRYSSGMYVRLAFAVAAHLEPEILLVDEVLAVGDVSFQKKCLGKMGEVTDREGRTVLFVSHNMAAVEKLCQRGVVLHQGSIKYIGSQTEAIARYLASFADTCVSLRDRSDRAGSGEIRVTAVDIRDKQGNSLDVVQSGQTIDICLFFESKTTAKLSGVIASLAVKTQLEMPVFLQHNRLTNDEFGILPQKGAFICRIERLPLIPSTYNVTYSVMRNDNYIDFIKNAFQLSVVSGDFYASGEIPPVSHGFCLVNAKWRVEEQKAQTT